MDVHAGHASTPATGAADDESVLLNRIRGEFFEMPGMRVSFEQAVRLWSADAQSCRAALDRLVQSGFLIRDISGRYKRAHSGY